MTYICLFSPSISSATDRKVVVVGRRYRDWRQKQEAIDGRYRISFTCDIEQNEGVNTVLGEGGAFGGRHICKPACFILLHEPRY